MSISLSLTDVLIAPNFSVTRILEFLPPKRGTRHEIPNCDRRYVEMCFVIMIWVPCKWYAFRLLRKYILEVQ